MVKRISLEVLKSSGNQILNREAWSDGSIIWYDRSGRQCEDWESKLFEDQYQKSINTNK